ncbi:MULTISPECIES: glycosyl hydrolase 115 family protein [unclassified Paenibacillus]|uniref:glycosyl hydrolase 115 family protein n=1 Tax=unclassified Paenibacillus TaxID=185978 RepID=UPI0036458F87
MKNRIKRWIALAFVFTMILQTSIAAAAVTANAAEAKGLEKQISNPGSYVSTETTGNDFKLVENGISANLFVDNNDSISVKRAVNDFKKDIKNVTNVEAQIANSIPNSGNVVIFGTIGSSEAIDTLINNNKLNVEELKNSDGSYKWEGFIIDVVENPFAGVGKALVVAGTDRRGTIFGLYDISEKMGVSPWYYFADVAISKKENVYIKADTRIIDSPDVQYRGIFLNDEEKLNEWAKANSNNGTIGPEVYNKIYELLLRLKANYLWPAMHVNGFNNNPENARLADEYGIVMGSSHPEMFLRNNNMEWPDWKKNYDAIHKTDVKYDYTVSPEAVLQFWKDSLTRNKNYESQWTLGMRGAHDEPFTTANINNGTFPGATELERKVNLLGKIIKDQQGMMKEVLGEEGYKKAFKLLIPYKEVLPLYDAGLEVPDDLTIMWVDDNHGYMRRLPNEAERKRSGGHGLYYHVSYWAPADQSYLWLGGSPLALMAEELQKSYESGIQKAWVLNVGDLKPLEGEMEFFLRYGWDVHKYENNPNKFLKEWISRQYGLQYADEVTDIVNTYYQLTRNRRPEHMRIDAFDQLHYGDEATKRMVAYQNIFDRANSVYNSLPENMRDGFYEQVLSKIRWVYYVNKSYYYADRSNMAYDQGRLSSANNYLALSQEADQKKKDEITYYNKGLAGGKWNKIMDPEVHAPPIIPQWPAGSPALKLGDPEMGAIVQGEENVSDNSVIEFSEFNQGGKYLDIFNKGAGSFEWTASADKEWIKLSKTSGTIMDEDRIWVNISNLSSHKGESSLITLKSGAIEKTITVRIRATSIGLDNVQGYAEADGYISMEAEHYSRKNDAGALRWQEIYNLGRTKGDVMRSYNPSLTRVPEDKIKESAPSLEYDVQFESAGKFPMQIYRVPTLDSKGTIKFAVSIDNGDPIVVSSNAVDEGQGTDWVKNLFPHIEKHVTNVNIPTVGKHTVKLWMIDNYIMIDKMVIYTDERGILYADNGPAESYHSTYNNTFSSGFDMLPRTAPVAQTKKDITASWGKGAILEKNGKVSIEPEIAMENSEYAKVIAKSGNSWRITQSDTGYAMRLPDKGEIWSNAADLVSKSPEMQFKVKFSTPGTYNVWMKTRLIDESADSIYGGIDGVYKSQSFDTSGFWNYGIDEKWVWPSKKYGTITVPTAGEHTFNVWMREDGIVVDRIYLTTSSENPPSDASWVVSERALENPDSIALTKMSSAIDAVEKRLQDAPVPVGTDVGSYGKAEYDLVLSSIQELKNLRDSGTRDMTVIDNAIAKLSDAERNLRNSQKLVDGPFKYIAYQNFDRNELGKLPYGFNVQSLTNGGQAFVAEEDGKRFLRFASSSTSGTQALLQLPFGEEGAAGKEIVIEMKVRLPKSAGFTNFAYISTAPGSYAIAAAFDQNTDKTKKQVMMQDDQNKKMVAAFEDNKWYDVKFVVNTTNKTYSGYFNNQLVAKDFKFRVQDGDKLNFYMFGLDKYVDGIYDVDDMKVYLAATAEEIAHAITSLTYHNNALDLPNNSGYKLEIASSSHPEIISTDGVVTPQKKDEEVKVMIKVTKISDGTTAVTAPITVLVEAENKLAMPAASPVPGTYTSAQKVSLTSATAGASIYYTIDGSNPTTGSALYTGEIDVKESKTIKAIAVKEGMAYSNVAEFKYKILSESGAYAVETTFNIASLQPSETLTAKVKVTNHDAAEQPVLVIVALYDSNEQMVNLSFISKVVANGSSEYLNAGFKLPANVEGHEARVFVWKGADLESSGMNPLANITTLR